MDTRSDAYAARLVARQGVWWKRLLRGLAPDPWRSFPLPRTAGRFFTYNEFIVAARKLS